MRAGRLVRALAAAVGVAAITVRAHAATPAAIDRAIRRGVDFLYSRQNEHVNWEFDQKPPPAGTLGGGIDAGQWGGRTALCTYALLATGERPVEPRVSKPVEFLRTARITGTYALGLRANVWFYLPQTPANQTALRNDAGLLRKNIALTSAAPNFGFFDYNAGGPRADHSASQYGVLGCWAAAQRLPVFDESYWGLIEKAWQKSQLPDGGWTYTGRDGASTLQMTAAGVATLFITQELAHATDAADGDRPDIQRGLDWIAAHLQEHLKSPSLYALYGVERVGVASGYKYIGDVDWFKDCADVLVRTQADDGSWGGEHGQEVNTAFALLFLSRGRAPVAVSKLQYEISGRADPKKKASADWNDHPRDLANVTRWAEEKTERRLNWEVVSLKVASPDDLHDANLLYVTGRKSTFNLAPEEKAKLKQFVEEGGLIIASAGGSTTPFARTFQTFGEGLFPGRKFETPDPKSDVLLTGEQFPIAGQKRPVKVLALGNGARHFMLLVPDDDLSRVFQRKDFTHESAYQFFANAFLYSVEKTDTRFKGETFVVRPDETVQTTSSAVVARVKYDGAWDPEPGGWRRLAAVMHNEARVKLETPPWSPADPPPAECLLAHLTGAEAVKFTPTERAGLQHFIDAGGLLVVDDCGGGPAFDAAVRAELTRLVPDAEAQLVAPLAPDDPVFQAADGTPTKPAYRPFALPELGPRAKAFQLRGLRVNGKLAVLYSPQDLSVGLVGQPVDGITGYTPAVATTLMRRIIELKTAGKI